MLINQNELEKLCKYLYPKLFDYKDIVLKFHGPVPQYLVLEN